MEASYLTLNEAAKLEGIDYFTLYRKVERNNSGFEITTVEPENGGKSRVLISINSLSKKAKKTYMELQKIDVTPLVTESVDGNAAPWYVDVDVKWYIEKYKKHYDKALSLIDYVEEYLNYSGKNKTPYCKSVAARAGMKQRTFYDKTKAYSEASGWAIRMQEQDGMNYDFYKVLALCPTPKANYKFTSISPECKVAIENVWFDKLFAQNLNTREKLYKILKNKGFEKGFDVPSYATVCRYVEFLMDVQGLSSAHYLQSKGSREWKNRLMYKCRRDASTLEVMELIVGDVHKFDCWVSIKHDNGKITAARPCLVGWLDMRSRCLVGYVITFIPDAQIIKESLLNVIYPKKNSPFEGVPQGILIDNGKEYTAESITGQNRKIRFTIDSETNGFLKSIGIEDYSRSLPYQPWSKPIERFFKTMIDDFTKTMFSYTGTLTTSRTENKIKKDIPKMLEKGQLMTIEEFSQKFDTWLNNEYHVSEHSSLEEENKELNLKTPLDVYTNAERYYKPAPPLDFAQMLMMKADDCRVYSTGIERFGFTYWNDALFPYVNKHVDIKFDPNDVRSILVYNKEDGRKICEADCPELMQFGRRVSQERLERLMRTQKRQLREAREVIERATTPFEQRFEEVEENKNKMTIGPELEGRSKAVALPEDRQYKEEVAEKKKTNSRKKKSGYKDKFLNSQADKALAAINKIS